MILNFWEQNGYSGLVDNMVQAITELHTYMATDPCGYTSPPEIQMYGVENYSLSRGYPFDAELVDSPSFDSFVQEIDAGRPVFVNSSSHAFVIKGYDTNGEWLLVDWNFGNGNNDDWQPFSSLGIVRAITILPPVDVVNDYNNDGEQDVFGILKYGGQSGQTEVHILDGADDFHSFLIHLATILTQVGPDGAWVFVLADYNEDRKPDLYAINKATGQSGMTEVHILNGADNFQSFLVNLGTALHQTGTDGAWMFGLSDYNGDRKPDLYAIDKAGGQSGMTEVHVLNGADNFQSFLLHTATALHQTGTDGAWMFGLGDYNGDRKPDLYAIDKAGGQSGMTEVHVLNGADNFQSFLTNAATALQQTGTDEAWVFNIGDYNKDRKPDLYAIDKAGGQSGMTEVHILNGADNFQSFLLHAATGLHPSGTDCSWDFATGQCALETPEPTLTVYLPYAVRRLQH